MFSMVPGFVISAATSAELWQINREKLQTDGVLFHGLVTAKAAAYVCWDAAVNWDENV